MSKTEVRSPDGDRTNIHFLLPDSYRFSLNSLPWSFPLETWPEHGTKFILIKSGLSRHVVRFLESGGHRFAIKETSLEAARNEIGCYERLLQLEIPTLVPIGVVVRNEGLESVNTNVGLQLHQRQVGYVVTELMEKVLPDLFLFRRAFSEVSRKRIWDAVITLFVQMHTRGVYWGDASLNNMLIRFQTETVPELGNRTVLTAVLADAETVEIHPSLSERMKAADVEFFLESMLWTDADLRASGVVRDHIMTQDDQAYILASYKERYDLDIEMRAFELVTHIDVDKLLGSFNVKGHGQLLLKHINEHKWYISERQGCEIPLIEAAENWYKEVFKPVCRIFNEHGLMAFFPGTTASSLYAEIMEHKYFMSEREQRDVGLLAALEDYSKKFSVHEPMQSTIATILKSLRLFLSGKLGMSQNIYLV